MNSAGVKIIALHKESNCIMSNITIESKKICFLVLVFIFPSLAQEPL